MEVVVGFNGAAYQGYLTLFNGLSAVLLLALVKDIVLYFQKKGFIGKDCTLFLVCLG